MKNPNAFGLIGPLAEYAIISEEHGLWTKRIQQAIEKHMETLTKTQDASLQKERDLHMKWDDPHRYGSYVFPEGQVYSGYWNLGFVCTCFRLAYPMMEHSLSLSLKEKENMNTWAVYTRVNGTDLSEVVKEK